MVGGLDPVVSGSVRLISSPLAIAAASMFVCLVQVLGVVRLMGAGAIYIVVLSLNMLVS